jgi:hypothetical protein
MVFLDLKNKLFISNLRNSPVSDPQLETFAQLVRNYTVGTSEEGARA